jgi:hypothetical protein
MRGGSGTSRGGSLPTGERRPAGSGNSVGRRCRWRAGEGERGGALTGGTGLSAGVDGGEAVAYAGRTWAGPGRKRVGRAQMNSRISDLF